MSDYCRLAQTVLSFPPMEGFEADFDFGVKQVDRSSSDGLSMPFILYANSVLWRRLMMTKDLQP